MRYEHRQERTAVQKQVKRAGIHAVVCVTRISNTWVHIEAGRLAVMAHIHCPAIAHGEDSLVEDHQHVLVSERWGDDSPGEWCRASARRALAPRNWACSTGLSMYASKTR